MMDSLNSKCSCRLTLPIEIIARYEEYFPGEGEELPKYLWIEAEGGYLTTIHTQNLDEEQGHKAVDETLADDPLMIQTRLQLTDYFMEGRKQFTLPYRWKGSVFRQKVWNELIKIPYGNTRSYGQIAGSIKNPNASRAVGGAVHNNPLMILVPCHRVIGASGSLTGFGAGLPMKKMLLMIEGYYRCPGAFFENR
jgi:methylated-DNA-[protein]-cysteine S-methyltransferase